MFSKKSMEPSDDLERYIKMALRIDPKNPEALVRIANDFTCNTLGNFFLSGD